MVSCRRKRSLLLGTAALVLWARSGLAQAPEQQNGVVLPEVVERVDARYPEAATSSTEVVSVLLVLVRTDGSVEEVTVAQSGGDAFDAAARQAALLWKFKAATRNGQPVKARVKVPFFFPAKSPPATAHPDAASPTTAAASAPPDPAFKSSAPPASTPTVTPPTVPSRPPSAQAGPERPAEVIVQGHYRPPARGTSDFHIDVGQLSRVPRKGAGELLQLAPGILLTNEGGDGHAHQVFLRGFDAREGQDIEFSVGGVPINEAGNLHGNGHADTHFIIPETVLSLRVLEGPFDPRQGNFAVAGSADYLLGLEQRGTTAKYTVGSYGTERVLALWGPPGLSRCTFGAAEIFRTQGFGQNRDARRGSGVMQYEGRFGSKGSYRVTGQGYGASYHSAGVLREDDYRSGRVGFFDSYDPWQGGDSSRFSLAADIEESIGGSLVRQQIYLIRNTMRMRKNYTGFLLDVQEPTQNPHSQRGDRIDLSVDSWTLGAKGASRVKETIAGKKQELELGVAARGDFGDGSQLRVQASNAVPYRREVDVGYSLGEFGVYGDLSLRPVDWLTLRGGVRASLFTYNVLDRCAQSSVRQPSRSDPPGDQSCLDQQDLGRYRDPTQRASTSNTAVLPRVTLLTTPAAGLVLSASYGQGVRSIDPSYISQDLATPFARVQAYETGAVFSRDLLQTQFVARLAAFRTHVDRDLLFNETAGRNTLAEGTTRNGVLSAVRWTGTWFDESVNVTLVRSTFDDTGLLIPYVPDVVLRSDTALHHELPLRLWKAPLQGALGGGVTYVGHRPLPYGQRSDTIFTVDASVTLWWRNVELGFEVTNLFDRRYRLGEYNYVSDFQSEPQPTLVPARHFSAGPPRAFYLTLGLSLGGEA